MDFPGVADSRLRSPLISFWTTSCFAESRRIIVILAHMNSNLSSHPRVFPWVDFQPYRSYYHFWTKNFAVVLSSRHFYLGISLKSVSASTSSHLSGETDHDTLPPMQNSIDGIYLVPILIPHLLYGMRNSKP